MRALEKDRDRRYESASALAADVRRSLADEPVLACPPSAAYRFRKFARRYRAMLTTLAAVAVALLLGTGVSVWQMIEADRARRLADERLEKERLARADADVQHQRAQASFEKALDAVKRMLTEVADVKVAAIPQMHAVRVRLLEDALAFYTDLIALNPTNARTYFERGQVAVMLGRSAKYDGDLFKAIELEPENGEYYYAWAASLQYVGPRAYANFDEFLRIAKRAVELKPTIESRMLLAVAYKKVARNDDAVAEYRKAAELAPGTGKAYEALGRAALLRGRVREACAHYQKALELNPEEHTAYWDLTELLESLGEHRQAIEVVSRGLDSAAIPNSLRPYHLLLRAKIYVSQRTYALALADCDRALEDPGARTQWFVYKRRALIHFYLGHYEQALADLAKCAELGPNDFSTFAWIPEAEIAACPDEGFRKGFLALAERGLATFLAKTDTPPADRAYTYAVRARLLAAFDQAERARADFQRALPLFEQNLAERKAKLGPADYWTQVTMCRLVEAGVRAGQFDRVKPVLSEFLAHVSRKNRPEVDDEQLALLGQTSLDFSFYDTRLAGLGQYLLETQKYAAAEPLLRECLAVREKKLPDDWLRFDAASLLGDALLGQQKNAEAEPLLLQGYDGLKRRESQMPKGFRFLAIRLNQAAERLFRLYEATGQPQKAARWREKLKAKVE
jgi:tetratricopeptide (TPR) repeat protein